MPTKKHVGKRGQKVLRKIALNCLRETKVCSPTCSLLILLSPSAAPSCGSRRQRWGGGRGGGGGGGRSLSSGQDEAKHRHTAPFHPRRPRMVSERRDRVSPQGHTVCGSIGAFTPTFQSLPYRTRPPPPVRGSACLPSGAPDALSNLQASLLRALRTGPLAGRLARFGFRMRPSAIAV